MADIMQLVKQISVEAVEAGKPVQVLFGTVISTDPLQIRTDSQTVYPETMLILTRNVTDYEMDIEVSHMTEADPEEHWHYYKGIKKIAVRNALMEGDQVVLARVQNGKRYVVLDRTAAIPELTGEWI